MISTRVKNISSSHTKEISAMARKMAAEGVSMISLSEGEPGFKTPSHICNAAMDAIAEGHHGITMLTGIPELREAISNKFRHDNNLDYSIDQIIVSNGAKQAIGFTMLATLNPGDEVIIPAPYWIFYPEMVKLADGKPVVIQTYFEDDFKITPEQLDEAITPKTKAVIFCSPSNPTGACYTGKEFGELAAVLDQNPEVLIYSDEIYEYINFIGSHVNILNVAPQLKDRTIIFNGFSKGFAMTGWRLGYMAGPKIIAGAMAEIQGQEASATSTISQHAGIAAYTGSRKPVRKMCEAYRERRDYVVEILNTIEGVNCFTPSGAFYAFPDISHFLGMKTPDGKSVNSSTELALYLLRDHRVAILPGDAVGEPSGIRLSYASSMEDLREAMKRIKRGLDSLS